MSVAARIKRVCVSDSQSREERHGYIQLTTDNGQLTVRLAWIDNLRTAMIFLVVCMHACVTYSHVGSWYIMEGADPPLAAKFPYILWQGHLQSFFMGLLFFLAGVFAWRSFARHGTTRFVKERLVRLGAPALLFMAVIHPFVVYVLLGESRIPNRPSLAVLYWDYCKSLRILSGNGPLWFAVALLIFSVAFALGWNWVKGSNNAAAQPEIHPKPAPSAKSLLLFGCALVITTFGIRLVQPIGTNILNMQLCFFPQYIAAFGAGIAAGRAGWLQELANARRARIAGWIALIGGPLLLSLLLIFGVPAKGDDPIRVFTGGWHWQAFGLAFWEQWTGLGLGLGAMALFQKHFQFAGAAARWLSDRAFGVYVLHTPIVVALTPALRIFDIGVASHAALLTAVGLIASFLTADVARRLPGFRQIL